MTLKELSQTLKIYGFKMIKPSFTESDMTGAVIFNAYTKCAGIVYNFYIRPDQKYAVATRLSAVWQNDEDDVSNMFFA